MIDSKSRSALQQYRRVAVQSSVESATPHRLIQMLLEGALAKIAQASGHMNRGEIPEKCRHIGWAISIIGGLRGSLDLDAGGELAANLDALYEYMEGRLLQANLKNDAGALEEVHELLAKIKSGWDGIAENPPATSGVAAGVAPAAARP